MEGDRSRGSVGAGGGYPPHPSQQQQQLPDLPGLARGRAPELGELIPVDNFFSEYVEELTSFNGGAAGPGEGPIGWWVPTKAALPVRLRTADPLWNLARPRPMCACRRTSGANGAAATPCRWRAAAAAAARAAAVACQWAFGRGPVTAAVCVGRPAGAKCTAWV